MVLEIFAIPELCHRVLFFLPKTDVVAVRSTCKVLKRAVDDFNVRARTWFEYRHRTAPCVSLFSRKYPVVISREAIQRMSREKVSKRWMFYPALTLEMVEIVATVLDGVNSDVSKLCAVMKACDKSHEFKDRLMPLVTPVVRSVIDRTHPVFQGQPTDDFTDKQKVELWIFANTPVTRQLTLEFVQKYPRFFVVSRELLTKYWFDDTELRRALITEAVVKKDTYTRLVFKKCPEQWRTEIPWHWWSDPFFNIGGVLPVVPGGVLKELIAELPRTRVPILVTTEWTIDLIKAIPTHWHTRLVVDRGVSDGFRNEIKLYLTPRNSRLSLIRQGYLIMEKLIDYAVFHEALNDDSHTFDMFLDSHIGHVKMTPDQYSHLLCVRLAIGKIDEEYHGEWYAAAIRSGGNPPHWLVLKPDNQLHCSLFKLFLNTYPNQVLIGLPESVKERIRYNYNAIELK